MIIFIFLSQINVQHPIVSTKKRVEKLNKNENMKRSGAQYSCIFYSEQNKMIYVGSNQYSSKYAILKEIENFVEFNFT